MLDTANDPLEQISANASESLLPNPLRTSQVMPRRAIMKRVTIVGLISLLSIILAACDDSSSSSVPSDSTPLPNSNGPSDGSSNSNGGGSK
jgi:hypothetical protein